MRLRATPLVSLALALGAVACGGDDAESGTVSQAFSSNCARCHGGGGAGIGDAPALPGDLSQDQFVAVVRAGKGGRMPAFSTSQISDAELAEAYAALKAR